METGRTRAAYRDGSPAQAEPARPDRPPVAEGPASARPGSRQPRVGLFNVKYSPNLGDGLLCQCLERTLIACGADARSTSIDLAARTAFAPPGAGRQMQMRLLESLPPWLRHRAVRVPLAIEARRHWRPHYRAALSEVDAVVIGGGNLLADLDLNFPTKIALAIAEAARRDLPVFIFGCGMSEGWSEAGRRLLAGALDRGLVRQVALRDERSAAIWDGLFGSRHGLPAKVVRDPGLLAAACFPTAPETEDAGSPPLGFPPGLPLGLNVTSQLALRYHSDRAPGEAQLDRWYLDLVAELTSAGERVIVFTNGSPEDRATVRRLRPALAAAGPPGTVSFIQPETPEELVRLVAGLGALAAFRMHAVIAAYSRDIPFVALAWDAKLETFVNSVDRRSWLCRPLVHDGRQTARRLIEVRGGGCDPAERDRVVAQARKDVATLCRAIVAATADG